MQHTIKDYVLLALFLSFAVFAPTIAHTTGTRPLLNKSNLTAELRVAFPSSTSASMNWDAMPGATNYNVKVDDLTLGQNVTILNTATTSAQVSGLVTGHLHRFSVQSNSESIIIELIVQ